MPDVDWPKPIPREIEVKCVKNYWKNSQWVTNGVCAVCGRISHNDNTLIYILSNSKEWQEFKKKLIINDNDLLNVVRAQPGRRNTWETDPNLMDVILENSGVHFLLELKLNHIAICLQCYTSLKKKKTPKYALCNFLYRGDLPKEFEDLMQSLDPNK